MKIIASGHIEGTEPVRIHDRADLGVTILVTGDPMSGRDDSLYITGTVAERADFLRRLSRAADLFASDLMAEVSA